MSPCHCPRKCEQKQRTFSGPKWFWFAWSASAFAGGVLLAVGHILGEPWAGIADGIDFIAALILGALAARRLMRDDREQPPTRVIWGPDGEPLSRVLTRRDE
jgi:hypothetical protein